MNEHKLGNELVIPKNKVPQFANKLLVYNIDWNDGFRIKDLVCNTFL